jgi:UDP:flavonoid glycosyltransferase YjiC (YdhE family)
MPRRIGWASALNGSLTRMLTVPCPAVRVLFTFVGGRGHFEPLVPIARAAVAAGDEVAFASGGLMQVVEAAGFAEFTVAPIRPLPPRRPLQGVDLEHELRVLREVFFGSWARERAPATLALCAEWRPDALVCDEADLGSMVAAERLALPYAVVLEGASGSLITPDLVAQAMDALRAEHDVAACAPLVLSPFPPSLRDPAVPLPSGAVSLRPPLGSGGQVPDWLARLDGAVLFTLGTVFNVEAGDLFIRVLAGLRELGRPVIVTVGDELDPAELGPQPSHVHVTTFVPLGAALPRCAAVVSHGGSGSVVATLAHGLPSVLVPMGADQPGNAARCSALGVARVLEVLTATPADVGAAVSSVLSEPSYREAAERVRDEIAALPGPDHAVELLRGLVDDR